MQEEEQVERRVATPLSAAFGDTGRTVPVDDTSVVDFVGFSPSGEAVALTISDHLDWQSPRDHLLILQDKLNLYIAFVEAENYSRSFQLQSTS